MSHRQKLLPLISWRSYAIVLLIFALAPSARLLLSFAQSLIGKDNIPLLISAIFLMLSIYIINRIGAKTKRVIGGFALLAIGGIGALTLPIAEERLHLLLFGVLGFSLSNDLATLPKSYFLAFFMGSGIGIADELFQWALPNRVGDFRDVVINSIGTLWGIALHAVFTHQEPKANIPLTEDRN